MGSCTICIRRKCSLDALLPKSFPMKIPLLFLILFIIMSCSGTYENCNQIKIERRKLLWIQGYNLNDQIVLKSDQGNFDTLELIEKSVGFSPCNKFELGPNQYESYNYTFLSSNFKQVENKSAGLSYSTDDVLYGKNKMMVSAFGLNWASSDLGIDKKIYKETIKVQGVTDSIETMRFKSSNCLSDVPEIKYFNWSKRYGLVKYQTNSGETYEYFKKL